MLRSILIIAFVTVALIYTKQIKRSVLSAFFNNNNIMPIYSVEIPDKRIALTFDLEWGNGYTQEILDALKRYNVKATFFITGAWAKKHTEIVKVIDLYKHEIGNHSLNHINMTGLTQESMSAQIKETESIINKLTGKNTKLFRAPFGEYDDKLVSLVNRMQYKMIQWDIDSLDLQGFDEKEISERVVSKIGNGSIILFHDNIKATPKALLNIIEKLKKDNYQFVTVSELLIKDNYYIDNTGRQRPLE